MISDDAQTDEDDMRKTSGEYDVNKVEPIFQPNGDTAAAPQDIKPVAALTSSPKIILEDADSERGTFRAFVAHDCTCHGVRYLVNKPAHHLRRIVWGVLLVLTTCCFLALLIIQAQKYNQDQPGNIISRHIADQLPFPAVTVCTKNTPRNSKLKELGLYDIVTQARNIIEQRVAYAGCQDYFEVIRGECDIESGLRAEASSSVTDISIQECQDLCASPQGFTNCSGIFFRLNDRRCVASSYTPGTLSQQSSARCDENVLYYRRHRCLNVEAFRCTFEEPCDYLTAPGFTSYKTREGADHTLDGKAAGHYVPLGRRNGMTSIEIPYMNITGKCLRFLHMVFPSVNDDITTIKATIRGEDLQTTDTLSFTVPGGQRGWSPVHATLPGGVRSISISQTPGLISGEAHLDDLQITDCQNTVRECRTGKKGIEYLGAMNRTRYNEPCLSWTDPRVQSGFSSVISVSPTLADTDAHNYCRNVDNDDNGPWCVTDSVEKQYCSIPYCGCPKNWFQCGSGECFPRSIICDGSLNCDDGSDEGEILCGEHSLGVTSKDGDTTVIGDKAIIVSPAQTFHNGDQITFDYLFQPAEDDVISSLELNLIDQYNQPRHIWNVTARHWEKGNATWASKDLCLSNGTYKLQWTYTTGMYARGQAAVDTVRIVRGTACQPPSSEADINRGRSRCDFTTDHCGHTQEAGNEFFRWQLIPVEKLVTAATTPKYYGGCNGSMYDVSGYISYYTDLTTAGHATFTCIQTIENHRDMPLTLQFNDLQTRKCRVEYLSVYDGLSRVVYCGSVTTLPSDFTSGRNSVNIAVTGNYSQPDSTDRYSGFQAQYQTHTHPDTDYAIAASFKLDEKEDSRSSVLLSPLYEIHQGSCLLLSIMVLSPLEIKINEFTDEGMKQRTLMKIDSSQGLHWHKVHLDLLPWKSVNESMQFQLEYHSLFDPHQTKQYTTAINSVEFLESSCQDNQKEWTDAHECEFKGEDQCDFIDISDGPTRWIRSHTNSRGFFMTVEMQDEVTESVLLSPPIILSGDACLEFTTRSDADYVYVGIKSKNTSEIVAYFGEKGKTEGRVGLPEGEMRIYFGGVGHASLEKNTVITLHDVKISMRPCSSNGMEEGTFKATLSGEDEERRVSDDAETIDEVILMNEGRHYHAARDARLAEQNMLASMSVSEAWTQAHSASHQDAQLIQSCVYNGKPCTDLQLTQTSSDGATCHTFNQDSSATIAKQEAGRTGGLFLSLDAENYDYSHSNQGGISFSVEEPGRNRPLLFFNVMSTGYVGNIRLNYQEDRTKKRGAARLISDSESCLDQCVRSHIKQSCDCSMHSSAGWNSNDDACDIIRTISCVEPALSAADLSCNCGEDGSSTFNYQMDIFTPRDDFPREASMVTRSPNIPLAKLDFIKKTKGIATYLDQLAQLSSATASENEEGVVEYAKEAIAHLTEDLRLDTSPLYRQIPELQNAFDYYLKPSCRALMETLNTLATTALNGANIGRHELYSSDGYSFSEGQDVLVNLQVLTDTAKTMITVTEETYGIVVSGYATHVLDPGMYRAINDKLLPTVRVADTPARQGCLELQQSIALLTDDIKSTAKQIAEGLRVLDLVNGTSWDLKRQISDLFTQLANQAANISVSTANLRTCLSDYEEFLEQLDQHNKLISALTPEEFRSTPLPTEQQDFTQTQSEFQIARKGLLNDDTISESRCREFNGIINDVKALNENMLHMYKYELKNSFTNWIYTARDTILKNYEQSLGNLILHTTYFNQTQDMKVAFQRSRIWRLPVPTKVDGDWVYVRSARDAEWSVPADIKRYLRDDGHFLMTAYIHSYFDDVIDEATAAFLKIGQHLKNSRGLFTEITCDRNSSYKDFARKNIAQLHINYASMDFTVIQATDKYDLASLVGDIGGYLALFLGGSFLTVFEIFDWLLVYVCCKRRQKKNMVV